MNKRKFDIFNLHKYRCTFETIKTRITKERIAKGRLAKPGDNQHYKDRVDTVAADVINITASFESAMSEVKEAGKLLDDGRQLIRKLETEKDDIQKKVDEASTTLRHRYGHVDFDVADENPFPKPTPCPKHELLDKLKKSKAGAAKDGKQKKTANASSASSAASSSTASTSAASPKTALEKPPTPPGQPIQKHPGGRNTIYTTVGFCHKCRSNADLTEAYGPATCERCIGKYTFVFTITRINRNVQLLRRGKGMQQCEGRCGPQRKCSFCALLAWAEDGYHAKR
ncbi:unnamed protein product, partial [Mesorhabditis spiculigera]